MLWDQEITVRVAEQTRQSEKTKETGRKSWRAVRAGEQ